ncbi:MAG: type II toxin-antitoxin system Phd/YefM family antitoxin [Candidatus Acidiferrales bacterium]
MKKVGTRELKNRLGHYLKRVRRGETLLITVRGETVARMEPVDGINTMESPLEKRLRELAAQGHIRLAPRRGFAPFKPLPCRGKPASQIIIEDRG